MPEYLTVRPLILKERLRMLARSVVNSCHSSWHNLTDAPFPPPRYLAPWRLESRVWGLYRFVAFFQEDARPGHLFPGHE
jgi:hypothetical protein